MKTRDSGCGQIVLYIDLCSPVPEVSVSDNDSDALSVSTGPLSFPVIVTLLANDIAISVVVFLSIVLWLTTKWTMNLQSTY